MDGIVCAVDRIYAREQEANDDIFLLQAQSHGCRGVMVVGAWASCMRLGAVDLE